MALALRGCVQNPVPGREDQQQQDEQQEPLGPGTQLDARVNGDRGQQPTEYFKIAARENFDCSNIYFFLKSMLCILSMYLKVPVYHHKHM